MLSAILKVRIKQFFRLLQELGWFRSLLSAAAFSFIITAVYVRAANERDAAIIAGSLLIALLYLHLFRTDRSFLAFIGAGPLLISVEYLLLITPFLVLLTVYASFFIPVLLIAGAGGIACIPAHFKIGNKHWRAFPLPSFLSFEWISGLRYAGFLFILTYVTGFVLLFFYPAAFFLTLAILTFICGTFYEESEPRALLEVVDLAPGPFLVFKIKQQLKVFGLIIMPLVVCFLILYPELWMILLVAVFISTLLQAFYVVLKYAFYEPGTDLSRNRLYNVLAFGCFTVVFLFPIPLILFFRFYRKAVSNLCLYLDAIR